MSVPEDFVRVEIVTGHTMVNLAYTEFGLGELDAANKAIHNAKTALQTAKRFLPFTPANNKSYEELALGIEGLQRAVDQYEQADNSARSARLERAE